MAKLKMSETVEVLFKDKNTGEVKHQESIKVADYVVKSK